MNPYELFWNYHINDRVPYVQEDKRYESHEIKASLEDRKTLQLVWLMYKEQGVAPTYLQQVLDIDIDDVCDTRARSNLATPLGARNNDTSVVGSVGTKQFSTIPSTIDPALTVHFTPTQSLNLSQSSTFSQGYGLATVGAVPQTSMETGVCKKKAVLVCDTLFLGSFHRQRLLSLAKVMNAVVDMDWVRAVASTVVGMDDPTGFVMLDDRHKYKDRHVHYRGGVRQCIELYQTMGDNSVITFSLENSEFAIHMSDFRTGMIRQLGQSGTQHKSETLVGESLSLVMVACSIGLPLRKLYTPSNFMSKWKKFRFFNVNRDNVVRTVLRDLLGSEPVVGNETTQLLLQYEQKQQMFAVGIENSNTTRQSVSTYFYNQWYSYPSKTELSTILLRLNAIKQFCFLNKTSLATKQDGF